jgi:hypothetical protein
MVRRLLVIEDGLVRGGAGMQQSLLRLMQVFHRQLQEFLLSQVVYAIACH